MKGLRKRRVLGGGPDVEHDRGRAPLEQPPSLLQWRQVLPASPDLPASVNGTRQQRCEFKTRAELRAIADLEKLRSALQSKLGTGPEAQKKIADILSTQRNTRLEIAKLQVKEIEQFERLQGVADGVGTAFETAGRKISDAFVEGRIEALDFKSVLRILVQDLQKTVIQVLILDQDSQDSFTL